MSAAAQGAFVDIFYIIKSLHPIPRRPPEEHAVSRGESSRITIQAFDSIAYAEISRGNIPKIKTKAPFGALAMRGRHARAEIQISLHAFVFPSHAKDTNGVSP